MHLVEAAGRLLLAEGEAERANRHRREGEPEARTAACPRIPTSGG